MVTQTKATNKSSSSRTKGSKNSTRFGEFDNNRAYFGDLPFLKVVQLTWLRSLLLYCCGCNPFCLSRQVSRVLRPGGKFVFVEVRALGGIIIVEIGCRYPKGSLSGRAVGQRRQCHQVHVVYERKISRYLWFCP